MITVSYERGFGGLTLTEAQRIALRTTLDSDGTLEATAGTGDIVLPERSSWQPLCCNARSKARLVYLAFLTWIVAMPMSIGAGLPGAQATVLFLINSCSHKVYLRVERWCDRMCIG